MAQKLKDTILNPILKGNPITVLVLGICSALAVTVQLKGALVMALSVIVVTGLSSFVCSLLRNTIPNRQKWHYSPWREFHQTPTGVYPLFRGSTKYSKV